MKKTMQIIACLALASALAGCASSGNGTLKTLTQQHAAQRIIPGKSTKADIKAAFGSASITPFRNGYELWLYQMGLSKIVDSLPYVNLLLDSANNDKELSILFDPAGIVKKYQLMDVQAELQADLPPAHLQGTSMTNR